MLLQFIVGINIYSQSINPEDNNLLKINNLSITNINSLLMDYSSLVQQSYTAMFEYPDSLNPKQEVMIIEKMEWASEYRNKLDENKFIMSQEQLIRFNKLRAKNSRVVEAIFLNETKIIVDKTYLDNE